MKSKNILITMAIVFGTIAGISAWLAQTTKTDSLFAVTVGGVILGGISFIGWVISLVISSFKEK